MEKNNLKFDEANKYLNKLEDERKNLKGKRMKRFDDLHLQNMRKFCRNFGQEYVNVSRQKVEKKSFEFIKECCSKNCHLKVNEENQKHLFEIYWSLANHDMKSVFLFGLMSKKSTDKTFSKWTYHVDINGIKIIICQKLFAEIFKVTKGRLHCLQVKIINGNSLADERGHHANRGNQIPDETWNLFRQFIDQIPKTESHYSMGKCQKQYFDDSIITMSWLFKKFSNILNENNLKLISYWSFRKFYIENFNVGFSLPKSDVCDLCFKMTNIGQNNLTEEQKLFFETHLKDYQNYKDLKTSILTSDLSTKLVIEFDYGQNKALPKLNNSSNFFSRSLWLFIFNLFVHNTKESFVYYFLEGEFKKGANSVSSFVFETLKKLNLRNFNEIILFSDSCPAQNKNSTVFKSFLYFANYFNIKITHVFPVKGHSYCVCDRQFGLITKKLKKIPVIEHPDQYLRILDELNFKIAKIDILNFESFFIQNFNTKLNIKISSLKKIIYHLNGQVFCFSGYDSNYQLYDFGSKMIKNWIVQLENDKTYFISKDKSNDLYKLINNLKIENQEFYRDHLSRYSIDNYHK